MGHEIPCCGPCKKDYSLSSAGDLDLLLAGDWLLSEESLSLELDLDLDESLFETDLDRLLLAFFAPLLNLGEVVFEWRETDRDFERLYGFGVFVESENASMKHGPWLCPILPVDEMQKI